MHERGYEMRCRDDELIRKMKGYGMKCKQLKQWRLMAIEASSHASLQTTATGYLAESRESSSMYPGHEENVLIVVTNPPFPILSPPRYSLYMLALVIQYVTTGNSFNVARLHDTFVTTILDFNTSYRSSWLLRLSVPI